MISRTDRKRPSAVLEDRLGSDRIADLDSSSFSCLHIETNCEKNRLLTGDNEILNSGGKTFSSKPSLSAYLNAKDVCRNSFEKLNKSKSNPGYISMASSPSKSKPDISSSLVPMLTTVGSSRAGWTDITICITVCVRRTSWVEVSN